MECPKCNSHLETLSFNSIEIDRCTRCKGIWFDLDEKEKIRSAKSAHEVDIGHAAVGEYYDSLRDVKCPRCDIEMEVQSFRKRRQIFYEACPKCQGAFFDAGEFREFCEPSLVEFFKKLFQGFRDGK